MTSLPAYAAVPRDDACDTDIVLDLVMGRPSAPTGAAMFEGRTAIVPVESDALARPRYVPARTDHPNLAAGERLLLECWPAIHRQCGKLLFAVHPYNDTSRTEEEWRFIYGSSSHGFDLDFGAIRLTVDNPYGVAQALVHEMAHHKLRAFGVQQETAMRLVLNDPAELYESPVIKNRKRPMTAVVHAQYSFMHVVALDIAMYRQAKSAGMRAIARGLLAKNLPRVEAGRQEMGRFLRTDEEGERFFSVFEEWSDKVIAESRELLASHACVPSS